jgi:dephospho-CoA kinase
MIVLGLTGSIGMRKSTAANMLRQLGVLVSDADAIVHDLLGLGGGAVAAVESAFPGSVENGAISRAQLGTKVFGNPAALKTLEHILHPLVEQNWERFLKQSQRGRQSVVALDISHLFEVGVDKRCDATVIVSASSFIQATRVLPRHGMTMEKLADIRTHKTNDLEKRRRATFVIPTGNGRCSTLRALARIVSLFRCRRYRVTGVSSHA